MNRKHALAILLMVHFACDGSYADFLNTVPVPTDDHAVSALVEIDRRIQTFKANHKRNYIFTVFGDHGNNHHEATQVDPTDILRDVGVAPVVSLGNDQALEAVPVVHVRISYLALHTHCSRIPEVVRRLSEDHRVHRRPPYHRRYPGP